MSGFMYNDSVNQSESQLILHIEEIDCDKVDNTIDTSLFIGWDENVSKYFLRGRRQDLTQNSDYVPYSFYCFSKQDLYNFISFIIDRDARINITLYNFNNIIFTSQEVLSFEFFERHKDKDYEIVGYDNATIDRKSLFNMLTILKNVYNY